MLARRRRIYALGLGAVIALLVLFHSGWRYLFDSPLTIRQNVRCLVFNLPSGGTTYTVARWLVAQELVKRPEFVRLFLWLNGTASKLKYGEYALVPGMTLRQFLQQIVDGKVVQRSFTIVEGWTFAQLLRELANTKVLEHRLTGMTPEQVMERLGHGGEMPEGRFAPDTYRFTKGFSDLDLLQVAYRLMQERLAYAWQKRAPGLPYTCIYSALIVASLIEKETAKVAEQPIIAGVILNRLRRGMRLQIDPTVIYSLGERFSGKLRKHDLAVQSAYNTYLHTGLPPTPICLPSNSALMAALHPADVSYLFYVARGDGSHYFSEQLAEHNRAIEQFLKSGDKKSSRRK